VTVSLQQIIRFAHRRRRAVLATAALLLVASIAGATRLRFDTDVLHLLPQSGTAVPAFERFLTRFGTLDQLFIVYTAPSGYQIADYAQSVDRAVDALRRAPEVRRVDAGTIDPARDWSYLADRQLLLLQGKRLDDALARLGTASMVRAIEDRRALLAVPSPAVQALVSQDPLGLFDLMRDELGAITPGLLPRPGDEGYVTADGRSRLVIVQPTRPPYDTAFSRQLFQRLGEVQKQPVPRDDAFDELPALGVAYAGGHRIAIETEALVRRESITNGLGSLALILPVLFLVFRSGWLALIGALPSILSLAVVLGVLGLAGVTLSAAATGASAMLFGLGIDGVVLLYVAYRLAIGSGLSAEAAIDRLVEPSASMLLGMWTTAATFLGLAVVDFPSLEQLGLLVGWSMVACGVLTLALVPALLSTRAPSRSMAPLTAPRLAAWVARHRRVIRIVAVVTTVALALAAFGLRVNPTLDRLRSTTPGAVFEEEVSRRFGLPRDAHVVLDEGADFERLLVRNERLVSDLARSTPGMIVQAPTSLLPSAAEQARRRVRVAAEGLSPSRVADRLAEAATSARFRPGAFAPFVDRLPQLLNPSRRVTYDGYRAHGLTGLIDRFVARNNGHYTVATYVYPRNDREAQSVQAIVSRAGDGAVVTGLPLVNQELAARFAPQFLKGLAIGSAVVAAMILIAFRNWQLSCLALVPTVLGLVWAAGLLALAGVTLDLFAVFAVVTFIGIGVDYGIHLVHRFRLRRDSIAAVSELVPVILVAGLITLAGYGTLARSAYPPLQSIGLVSIVSVITLVAASVLVLPALLPAPEEPVKLRAPDAPPPATPRG
jgi:uncharacterized protein